MIKVALFGIHKLLSQSLSVLERQGILPEIVVFPPFDSDYHSQVVEICNRNSVKYLRPISVRDPHFIDELQTYFIERIVVAGYHQIFPQRLLDLARMGVLNCHGGLLPEERGPVPWKWAVYENKPSTGVTIHQMTSKVDEGQIFYRERIKLDNDETSESLFDKIAESISLVVPRFINDVEVQSFQSEEISSAKPGYRGQVPQELCYFDLKQSAYELLRRVRALSPRPGVFLQYKDQKILVKKMQILPEARYENAWIFKSADHYVELTDYEIIKLQ